MQTKLYCHPQADDKILVDVRHHDDSEPYTVIKIGDDLAIFPKNAAQLIELHSAVGRLIDAYRRALTHSWAEAHPEQATPLDSAGQCAVCGAGTKQLFAVSIPLGVDGEREQVEACAVCARVDAELVSHPADPDGFGPDDVRAERHDDEQRCAGRVAS